MSSNNVYTSLLACALVGLLVAIVYVWMKSSAMTGTMNPFAIIP